MRSITPLALAIVLMATGTGAFAQLEEVIVTATKRAENLQDIPVSVTALSATTLQEAGVENIEDVAQLVPSLTVNTNINPFAAGVRIRGFGTQQNDPSLEASVAFILDGVYMGRSGMGMSDLTDVERIEVLQGPQGTLYGKNSNAGVVSVITKDPNTEENEGFVEATLGDYDNQRYVASSSGPINDALAYRLAGSWHDQNGWMENPGGDDLNGGTDWNARGKLLWQASDTLSLLLTGSHVDRNTSCCAADATQTSAITDQLIKQGLPVPKNDAFDWKNSVNVDSKFDLTADMITAKLDYDLEWGVITSLSAWNQYDYTTDTDGDRSQLDVLAVVDDKYSGNAWSEELRLTSELDGPLQYVAGLYAAHEKNTRGDGSSFTVIGNDVLSVAKAALPPPQNGLVRLVVQPGDYVTIDNTWETDTLALFGQTTYNFTDELALTLGGRYSNENKDADFLVTTYSSSVAGQDPSFPSSPLVDQAYAPIDQDFNRGDDGFTGLANLSYFVTPEIMIFTSVTSGTKSGGFNGVAGEGAPREFEPEDSTNYELGIKSRMLEDRLQLNATAFYTEFTDLQFIAQNTVGTGFYVSNAAEGTSQGIDMDFSAMPLDNLILGGGLQYLDAQYTKGLLEEFDVPFAPTWSGNLSATLLLPLADGMTYLRGDYSFMGDHFANNTYQPPATEQDKALLNARLGWRNDNWDAALWVKNITDEAYSAQTAAPLTFTGTEAEFLEAPRTYGVTVRYTF
jgi:iron complex outermembrane recepter protein